MWNVVQMTLEWVFNCGDSGNKWQSAEDSPGSIKRLELFLETVNPDVFHDNSEFV